MNTTPATASTLPLAHIQPQIQPFLTTNEAEAAIAVIRWEQSYLGLLIRWETSVRLTFNEWSLWAGELQAGHSARHPIKATLCRISTPQDPLFEKGHTPTNHSLD